MFDGIGIAADTFLVGEIVATLAFELTKTLQITKKVKIVENKF